MKKAVGPKKPDLCRAASLHKPVPFLRARGVQAAMYGYQISQYK
jgi:hypothetical protein